jgi:hypothetical protein
MLRSMENPEKAGIIADALLSWAAEITSKYHYAHVMFVRYAHLILHRQTW